MRGAALFSLLLAAASAVAQDTTATEPASEIAASGALPPTGPITRRAVIPDLGWRIGQALQRPEIAAQPDTAVALPGLGPALPGDLAAGEASVWLDQVAAGIDGLPLDPALRADLVRRCNARGAGRLGVALASGPGGAVPDRPRQR